MDLKDLTILLIPIGLFVLNSLSRKLLFTRKNIGRISASVDSISLQQVDHLYSPEVLIGYHFRIEDERFTGEDFVRIDAFLGDSLFFLGEQRSLPFLSASDGKYIGEEHIEHYLLSRKDHIDVEFFLKQPANNRVIQTENADETILGKLAPFPWVS